MKTIIIVAFLVALGLGQRLSINDANCNKYLQKFGTANNPDGTGATKLAFTGDVQFVPGTINVKVNLRYSDVDLFNDATYFGLVQEEYIYICNQNIYNKKKLLILMISKHRIVIIQFRSDQFNIKMNLETFLLDKIKICERIRKL